MTTNQPPRKLFAILNDLADGKITIPEAAEEIEAIQESAES